MQMYISFDIDEVGEAGQQSVVSVAIIKDWVFNNFLCLNDDKTEVSININA